MTYHLAIRHPNGSIQHLPFTSRVARDAALVALARQPVDLRIEDRAEEA